MHGVFTIKDGEIAMRMPCLDREAIDREEEGSMRMAGMTPEYEDFCIICSYSFSERDELTGFDVYTSPFEGFSVAAFYNYHDPSGIDGFSTPVTSGMAEKFHQFAEKLVAQRWSHGDISADNIFWDSRRECFRIARWQTFDPLGRSKDQDITILSRIEAVLNEWSLEVQ